MSSKLSLSMPSLALINTTVLNKSLSTMVNGIRGHKDRGELAYINKCINEIKEELSTPYADVKAQALQKLIYLQMIGYDISWASFNIVEVMSAPWFGHKRIGYLAASLCFTPQTDVILLTTHLFRKGFTQPASIGAATADGLQYETGAAISCLANIATPDLAMDLLNDVYSLMSSSRPYIRKKAVLVLLRLFKQWPKALRLSFDRLKEKLNDDNAGVVSAAVYVICELAAKNPKNYLSLAPQFFAILTTSSNNWVLIKVVKLLGSLSPLEPRLAKKLTEPLCDIITTTPAKSLLYECVNTLLAGELRSKSVTRLCLDKLRGFIEDPDQNLKYLGLLGLHKLMKKYPRAVSEHKDLILNLLQDDDPTIRMRALDLITSMVNQRNVQAIVRRMSEHLQQSEGVYREHVLARILQIGAQDNYSYIVDFEWYISVLVDLTHVSGASLHNARAITHQLTDVSIRVPGVRRYAVKAMCDVLLAGRLLTASGANNCMSEVLHAAAFVVGEFSEYVEEHVEVIRCMMRREVGGLSGETQNVFVQAVMKVLAAGLYQPYNQQGDDKDASMDVKVKDLLGRRHVDDDEDDKEDDSDEAKDQIDQPAAASSSSPSSPSARSSQAAEDADPEQEAEELDENGVKKRKVNAKRRTYHDYAVFVGEMLECLYTHLPLFCRSSHVEVQERAVSYHELVAWIVQHAQMQPFISVSVHGKTGKALADANDATNGDKALKAGSNNSASPALDLLDDSSASSARQQSNSDALPPPAILSSIAVQLCMLFSERLNPVNPKAQRKVPVPKGLDLNQPVHDGWDVDSDASDNDGDSADSDANDRSGGGRRRDRRDKDRKKARDGDRDRERAADKKKSRKGRESGGLYSDDEYSKAPLTAEEKAEAKRRLDARKQAQMSDPFYLVDKKATSSSSIAAAMAGADSAVRSASKDEMPAEAVRRDSDRDRDRRRSKKHRGGGGAAADDNDIFAGVEDSRPKKAYKVHKAEDMPSDALSSDDDKRGDGDGDDAPAKDAKKRSKKQHADRDAAHRDSKRDKKDSKPHRERSRRDRQQPRDKDADAEDRPRDRHGPDKDSRQRQGREKGAVDDLDPLNDGGAASGRSDEEDRKRTKKDKERKRDGEKDRDREKAKERKREKRSKA